MSIPNTEQILHDRVNLDRLVRRLDKALSQPGWTVHDTLDPWVVCRSMLQVNLASALLNIRRIMPTFTEAEIRTEAYAQRRNLRRNGPLTVCS